MRLEDNDDEESDDGQEKPCASTVNCSGPRVGSSSEAPTSGRAIEAKRTNEFSPCMLHQYSRIHDNLLPS